MPDSMTRNRNHQLYLNFIGVPYLNTIVPTDTLAVIRLYQKISLSFSRRYCSVFEALSSISFLVAFMEILIINQCCGCLNSTQIYRTTYNDTTEFLQRKNSGTGPLESIIYPVFGDPSQKKYYGMYYVPMYYLEEGLLITLKKTSGEIVNDLLLRIARLWPLLVVFLFMACISGFILWSIVS